MGVSGRKEPWTRCAGRPLSLPGCFLSAREQAGRADGTGARLAEGVAGRGWRVGAHPGFRAEPACAPAAVMPGAECASSSGLWCPGRSVHPLNPCSPPRWPQASSKPEVGSSLEEVHPHSFLSRRRPVAGRAQGLPHGVIRAHALIWNLSEELPPSGSRTSLLCTCARACAATFHCRECAAGVASPGGPPAPAILAGPCLHSGA